MLCWPITTETTRHHSPLAEVGAERGQEAGQAEAELVGGAERQSDHHRDQGQVHQERGPLAWGRPMF